MQHCGYLNIYPNFVLQENYGSNDLAKETTCVVHGKFARIFEKITTCRGRLQHMYAGVNFNLYVYIYTYYAYIFQQTL